ncbi:MAG TPA: HAMP domain-containing sensor histidine kinase [Ruminiclostridium sp.]|nr:HAMP domain-containing sensor histidine kinase [Ruminiclostridium sp.]
MKIRTSVSLIIIIYIIGFSYILSSYNTMVSTDIDTVSLNEVVKTVEANWGHIDKGDFRSTKEAFVVLDNDENVTFSTNPGLSLSINDALKKRDTIIDIVVNRVPVGKVIFNNNYTEVLHRLVNKITFATIITFTAIAILCIIYLIYLNYNIFRPFGQLKAFARNIAEGNLGIPLKMDRKNIFGAFTESFDIMREQLALARKNEYLANRSKKELVAGLSHDIKTPVASIKAVAELMLVLSSDEKEKQRLNTILHKAEQINLLVNDMFHATLEELEELKVIVKDESSYIIEDIIKNVNYFDKITYDKIPECIISVDPNRLQQVFDNILSNSYKYADTQVNITFQIVSDYLEVYIKDYGKGISEDELPLVFNKFYRGKNTAGQAGSGLGLYISRYLMKQMNGDISCENLDDGFKVTLSIKLS